MHSSLNAVVHLKVKLRKLVVLVSRSFLNITKRGSIYDVTDNEALDSLILGDSLSGGNAPEEKKDEYERGFKIFSMALVLD